MNFAASTLATPSEIAIPHPGTPDPETMT